MEILRSLDQIAEQLKKIFVFEEDFNFEDFISKKIALTEINKINKKDCENVDEEIEKFSNFLFQLRNYLFSLSNFVRILLHLNMKEELFNFIKRLFIGQIGQIKYSSTKENYNFEEKYFDRFVEIVKNADIERELYLPFILSAFESDKSDFLYAWKRPAIEFMQRFFNENEDWTFEYIKDHEDQKYRILAMITDFNTPRGVKMLIDDFKNENSDKVAYILKKYKRETFFELDKRLYSSSYNISQLVPILFIFGSDTEAVSRLKEIYERDIDEEIKNEIAERLDIISNPNGKTEKQFQYNVKRKVKDIQERTLGVPFDRFNLTYKSGTLADNATYTYIIDLFKDEKVLFNLSNLKYLYNVFEEEGLNDFANKVFENLKRKEDIKSAKWAVRMAALLCNKTQAKDLAYFASELFRNNRKKEAEYLIECLCYAGKIEALEAFKDEKLASFFEESWQKEMLEVLTKKCNLDGDSIKDLLVLGKTDQETMEKETNRLFKAYINDRKFASEYFDFLCQNEPFKTLFEHLIFGEYRFGRLNNAFIIKEGQKQYVVQIAKENILNTEDEKSDFEIGIVHRLDLDDRFENVYNVLSDPLFNQFEFGKYNVKDFSALGSEVSSFNGMFVSIQNFAEKIREFGFIKNVENGNISYSSLINFNEEINIACVINLDKAVLKDQEYSVLNSICFYKCSDLIENNGKYTFNISDALTIGSIPPRYFDYCLSCILISAK